MGYQAKEGVLEIRVVTLTQPDENGDSWSDVNYLYLDATVTESKIGLPQKGGKTGTEKVSE